MTQQIQIRFRFSNAFVESPETIFFHSQGIHGSALVEGEDHFQFDTVKLTLEGRVENLITHHPYNSRMPLEWRFRKTASIPAHPSEGTCESLTPARWTFPISFHLSNVPDDVSDIEAPWECHRDHLPSSVAAEPCQSRTEISPCRSEVSYTEYTIQCWILRGSLVCKHIARNVKIYGSQESPPPPICQDDFPGEYVCRQEKRLKRKLGVPGRVVSTEITEPPPVLVGPNGSSIAAYLRMQVKIDKGSGKSTRLPAELSFRISWALRTHTFISVVDQNQTPTAREASLSPFLEETIGVSETRNWGFSMTNWRRDFEQPSAWLQVKEILLPLLRDSHPAPTFFHPNISRRYSLILHLEVTAKHLGKACFDHVVPIQIFYGRPPASGIESVRSSNHLPRYVP